MNKKSVPRFGFSSKSDNRDVTVIYTCTTHLILAFIVFLIPVQNPECAESIAVPFRISAGLDNGGQFMSIRLLGVLRLANVSASGIRIGELSDLAWDADEQLLYAVSDQGYLLHLQPVFDNDILVDVLLSGKHDLQSSSGSRLQGDDADSEGLDISHGNNGIHGDSELTVSFEVKPRIERYTPSGKFLGSYTLPAELVSIGNYQSRNKALESVTIHPQYGIITAPERPLINTDAGTFTLYSPQGATWTYTPLNPVDSAITSLEMQSDGDLMVLERIYSNRFSSYSVAIRELPLSGQINRSEITTLALFKRDEGFLIDNFEGLSRHTDNRFFMVSDDNNNFFQQTLLMYFEIPDP
ncbi:MAG: hypothetical protein A2W28_11525 [Gammaproteobacteria bacterium RBG_16_51_14]|nr:MAG: hypothetical protein A2W28_11525 [Gammaproteobacteria bacterium RBG_16_51_14]